MSQRRGSQIGAGQLRPAGDRRAKLMPAGALPGSACEVGRDDVSGVPVQAAAAPVIPHRGPQVRMGGYLLDIAERDPGVQTGGDERVPKRVGRDELADPGAASGRADESHGGVPVQPPVVSGHEHRPFGPFSDGQVDRPGGPRRQRDGQDLAGTGASRARADALPAAASCWYSRARDRTWAARTLAGPSLLPRCGRDGPGREVA